MERVWLARYCCRCRCAAGDGGSMKGSSRAGAGGGLRGMMRSEEGCAGVGVLLREEVAREEGESGLVTVRWMGVGRAKGAGLPFAAGGGKFAIGESGETGDGGSEVLGGDSLLLTRVMAPAAGTLEEPRKADMGALMERWWETAVGSDVLSDHRSPSEVLVSVFRGWPLGLELDLLDLPTAAKSPKIPRCDGRDEVRGSEPPSWSIPPFSPPELLLENKLFPSFRLLKKRKSSPTIILRPTTPATVPPAIWPAVILL